MVSHPWCEDDGCSSSGGAYGFRHVRLQLKTETDEGEWGDSSLKPWKPSSRRGPRLSKCTIPSLVVLRLHLGMGYAVNFHFLLTKDCKARGISSVWFSLNSWLSIDPILLDLFWVFVSPHPLTLVMFSSSDAGWCSCPFPFSELLLLSSRSLRTDIFKWFVWMAFLPPSGSTKCRYWLHALTSMCVM